MDFKKATQKWYPIVNTFEFGVKFENTKTI